MAQKEATARIKINRLLEEAGWRFFAEGKRPADIQLEPKVALTTQALDALGENYEKPGKGFIDFLLLNDKGFPFIVLEAKSEDKNPLLLSSYIIGSSKFIEIQFEKARHYAFKRSLHKPLYRLWFQENLWL